MAEPTTEEIVSQIHDWAMDRIQSLMSEASNESVNSAFALASEFEEWFDDDDNSPEIEIMSIEKY